MQEKIEKITAEAWEIWTQTPFEQRSWPTFNAIIKSAIEEATKELQQSRDAWLVAHGIVRSSCKPHSASTGKAILSDCTCESEIGNRYCPFHGKPKSAATPSGGGTVICKCGMVNRGDNTSCFRCGERLCHTHRGESQTK